MHVKVKSCVNQLGGRPLQRCGSWISLSLCLFALGFPGPLSHAKTQIEAQLPEVASLLNELSPSHCFRVTWAAGSASPRGQTVQFKPLDNDQIGTKDASQAFEVIPPKSPGLEKLPGATRALFSPRRALVAIQLLTEKMSELEPLCAHSIEKQAANTERQLRELLVRLERSTADLDKKEKTLIAFDVETIGVVEGLQLPLAGTMAESPKTLPSPARFGRELGKFRNDNVAAIIHARGGDLAQPRAASRELNIPLVVLDLEKEIPNSVPYSDYLEEFYRAVLSGLGVRLASQEEREN